MYHCQGSPPAFDASSEFPLLRRLKPLPKRRRTSDVVAQASEPDDLIQPMAELFGGAESLADELIARVDTLSAQMGMQPYYSSVLGGGDIVQGTGSETLVKNLSGSFPQAFDLGAVYQQFAGRLGSGKQEEDHSEGDYTDHLQQPGNTKKRKVPANMTGSVNGREVSLPLSVEEEIGHSLLSTGRPDPDLDTLATPLSMTQLPRKGKMSPSTLAGLQHKELLKYRKRQLAAVLGALSLGDALALDQALSTHLPFVSTMFNSDSVPSKVRLSHRRGPRLARAAAAQASAHRAIPNGVSFPAAEFAFTFASTTSDRLVATREEVLALRSRFEAELARQAAKAAKAAAEAKQAALTARKASRTKRSSKIQPPLPSGDQSVDPLDVSPSGKGPGRKKKKRSSPLATASNPHHRNNYVPSRLPSSGHGNPAQATLNAQNSLGPPPLRFLSAELPPRRRKKEAVTPRAQIVNPVDEWICPRCEYSLFYSEGSDYRRAIRDRKQILRRRRRAQERAAGGLGSTKNPAKPNLDEEGHDDDSQSVVGVGKSSEWEEGLDSNKPRGRHHLQLG